MGGLDRRTTSRLARGGIDVDARIDLHGLTQAAAHRRLLGFLEDARRQGARIVLVITGKGAPAELAGPGDTGRGILRRAVPAWLEFAGLQAAGVGLQPGGTAPRRRWRPLCPPSAEEPVKEFRAWTNGMTPHRCQLHTVILRLDRRTHRSRKKLD